MFTFLHWSYTCSHADDLFPCPALLALKAFHDVSLLGVSPCLPNELLPGFMNHLLESIYFKFEVNLQIYLANFSFLMYWWQRWDLKGISDDIWRQGETTVVPTHPLSPLSFLPFTEVVVSSSWFELHSLCICSPNLIGFPFKAGWLGWQIILPKAKPTY